MKKLRLDLDRLEVQSFVVSEAPRSRGTIRGHDLFPTFFPAVGCGGVSDPNSIDVDCVYDPSLNSCGCVTPVE